MITGDNIEPSNQPSIVCTFKQQFCSYRSTSSMYIQRTVLCIYSSINWADISISMFIQPKVFWHLLNWQFRWYSTTSSVDFQPSVKRAPNHQLFGYTITQIVCTWSNNSSFHPSIVLIIHWSQCTVLLIVIHPSIHLSIHDKNFIELKFGLQHRYRLLIFDYPSHCIPSLYRQSLWSRRLFDNKVCFPSTHLSIHQSIIHLSSDWYNKLSQPLWQVEVTIYM